MRRSSRVTLVGAASLILTLAAPAAEASLAATASTAVVPVSSALPSTNPGLAALASGRNFCRGWVDSLKQTSSNRVTGVYTIDCTQASRIILSPVLQHGSAPTRQTTRCARAKRCSGRISVYKPSKRQAYTMYMHVATVEGLGACGDGADFAAFRCSGMTKIM